MLQHAALTGAHCYQRSHSVIAAPPHGICCLQFCAGSRRGRQVIARAAPEGGERSSTSADPASAPVTSTTKWERAPRDWDLKLVDEWKWEESGDALLSYGVLAGTLALGASGWLSGFRDGDLPYFIALAICTIYIGAHRGLTSKTRQNISLGQGAAAPVLASVSLFGLYLLVRFLPDIDLQSILNAYFWLLGAFSVAGALPGPLATLLGPLSQAKVSLPVPEGLLIDQEGEYITQGDLTLPGVLSLLIGVGVASADLACGHSNFTLNNLIACLIAADILQLLGLKSFKAAGVLLVGMLVYDVFWVFGTTPIAGESVMVTVATSDALTGPIKLLFPRTGAIPGDFPWKILGLGDIAIPGLLACLALRYDASRTPDMRSRARAAADAITNTKDKLPDGMTDRDIAIALGDAAEDAFEEVASLDDRFKAGEATREGETFPTVPREVMYNRQYFKAVMVAYVAGLVLAFAANTVTKLGQPALLYLCPATIGAVIVMADNRQEFKRVWEYEDKTRTPQELFEEAERKRKLKRGEVVSDEKSKGSSPSWWPFK